MASSSRNGDTGEQFHVLAVDDSQVDRVFMERLLKNSDCRVTTAENGVRAMEYLWSEKEQGQSKVNMIITDYSMPGMNGYELLKKVKGSSAMKDIPVVILSSENIPARIEK
ncbi:hypothetical protein Syun_000049 [Stephania yunnanensis]|uniref:Response regulatory domain-containing protein n=1 Tax=Stephania yunnanensis TaxID=152371 RepID=A0AAP0LF77_9MAGN